MKTITFRQTYFEYIFHFAIQTFLSLLGQALIAALSKALSLTAGCLSPSPG